MVEPQTLAKTFTLYNILGVKAGTNTPMGGDAGHGGETVLLLVDGGGTCWEVTVDGKTLKPERLEIRLYGDSEGETFVKALDFAVKVLKLQREGRHGPH